MSQLRIPHDAVVFVGDGRKALFLRNIGDAKFPNLRVERTFGKEQGIGLQQWVDIPDVTFQLTDVNQPVSKSNLVQGAGESVNVGKLQRAK